MLAGSGPYMVMSNSEITEGGYKVQAVEPEHIESIRQWRNSQIEVLRQSRPISSGEQQDYFREKIWPDKSSDSPANVVLMLLEGDMPIGYGGLVNIEWDYKRAEISFLLDSSIARTDSETGNLFSIWLRLMKRLAFKEFGLRRLTTETYAMRDIYIQTLEQHDFSREGRLRKHVYVNGLPVDALIHGCLAKEPSSESTSLNENVGLKNILITSASGKVPLVRAMQEAAHRINPASKVIASDMNPRVTTQFVADEFWEMPKISDLSLPTLINKCKELNINRILPTSDIELLFYAEAKQTLAKHGIEIIVSSPEAVRICQDKLVFPDSGGGKFPLIPSSVSPRDFEKSALVVKERFGTGSQGIGLDLSYESALFHARGLKDPIFQPMVHGPEISIDAYVTRTGNVHGLVLRHRDWVVSGESRVTTTFRQESFEEITTDIIRALGLTGPVVMQAIVSNSGLKVIEVNPRFGGASTISLSVGLDMLYWAMIECENINCQLPEFIRRPNKICQVRIPQDLVIYDPDF